MDSIEYFTSLFNTINLETTSRLFEILIELEANEVRDHCVLSSTIYL